MKTNPLIELREQEEGILNIACSISYKGNHSANFTSCWRKYWRKWERAWTRSNVCSRLNRTQFDFHSTTDSHPFRQITNSHLISNVVWKLHLSSHANASLLPHTSTKYSFRLFNKSYLKFQFSFRHFLECLQDCSSLLLSYRWRDDLF